MILEFEGRTAEAFRAYGDLALKVPDDAWVKLKYESIRSSATQGHLLEAEKAKATDKAKYIRELEQAAFFSPDLAAITLQIADHYYAEGDGLRSLPYYEAVQEKEPHNEAVLLKLAALYEKRQNFDLAMVTLDRLLALKPGDPFLEGEKKRVRDRFQELTLPEKFKRIFFKTEVNREELAALVGFYFDRHIALDQAPEILTDIDGSFAREQIIKTVTAGIMHARPDHTFQRFATPDRAAFAATLNALIDYLKGKALTLRFTPLTPGAGHRRPLAAAQGFPGHHLPGQLPGAGARRPGQLQPHHGRLPRRRHLRPEKDTERHRGIELSLTPCPPRCGMVAPDISQRLGMALRTSPEGEGERNYKSN